MAITREWVKLPVAWINDNGLRRLRWSKDASGGTAALMVLIALTHVAHEATGIAKITYSELQEAIDLSRTKISDGLKVLVREKLISCVTNARSTYQLTQADAPPWGKLPAKGLYRNGLIKAFGDFTLRSVVEFRALKIFLLLIARRNSNTNMAAIGYDAIAESTGIKRGNVKSALNILVINNLVHIERILRGGGNGYYHAYRIAHVDPYRHTGTSGHSDMNT